MNASEVLHEVISLLQGVRGTGDSGNFSACCPAHDDSSQSLGVGPGRNVPVVMTCYAGCSYEAIVEALVARGLDRSILAGRAGITVEEMAIHKRLPASFLFSLGLKNGSESRAFGIPYWTETYTGAPSDRPFRVRRRTDRSAKTGSSWLPGRGTCLYGLWKLNEWSNANPPIDYCVLVEGESDCWTGWYHNLPFLGIPGSKSVATLKNEVMSRFTRIYVWQEPDAAGTGFVIGIAKQLEKIGWHGSVKILSMSGVKDPSVLHCRNAELFDERFRQAMENAPDMPTIEELEIAARSSARTVPGSIVAMQDESADKPVPEPGFYGLTDLGNSQRLVLRHGVNMHHCQDWLTWNGQKWEIDELHQVRQWAFDTVASISAEAMKCGDTKEGMILREQILQHAKESESRRRIDDMINLAQSHKGIIVKHDKFDADPMVLNVANGIIDLETGTIHPHDRNRLCMKIAPVVFDPEARCPMFLKFMSDVMNADDDIINFMKVALGYSITGETSEQCFFFCYGTGGNGKTTIFELMSHILGDYQGKTQAETLMQHRGRDSGSATPELAALKGLRFLSASELNESGRLDEAKVKDMTGGDTITARQLFKNNFTFSPVFKLWMYGNHEPRIVGNDEGIWRRVCKIPFTVAIPKKNKIKQFDRLLKKESSGILNWLIEGCLQWRNEGLSVPPVIQQATAEYRMGQDDVQRFVEERVIQTGSDSDTVGKGVLYSIYEQWCSSEGIKPRYTNKLTASLKGKGFIDGRDGSHKYWVGIRVGEGENAGNSSSSDGIDFGSYQ